MTDSEIHIPGRNKEPIQKSSGAVIKISSDAYNALVDIYNESILPIKDIASILILEASKRVVYDRRNDLLVSQF